MVSLAERGCEVTCIRKEGPGCGPLFVVDGCQAVGRGGEDLPGPLPPWRVLAAV
jgi:hypothetical protein